MTSAVECRSVAATFGREVAGEPVDLGETVYVLGEPPEPYETLGDDAWTHRHQEVRVGSGTDEMVLVASPAVRVRRGSITITRPPRALIARRHAADVGRGHEAAVRDERDRRRASAGTACDRGRARASLSAVPNMRPADTCFGIWSTVLAEKTFRVPSARRSARG